MRIQTPLKWTVPLLNGTSGDWLIFLRHFASLPTVARLRSSVSRQTLSDNVSSRLATLIRLYLDFTVLPL